jgi:hypothetical protein
MIYIGKVYRADKIIDRSWLNNDKLTLKSNNWSSI